MPWLTNAPGSGEIQRSHSRGVQATTGLVGALLYGAFGPLECQKCGKIPRIEFPHEDRIKMHQRSFLMVLGAIGLAGLVIWLICMKDQ